MMSQKDDKPKPPQKPKPDKDLIPSCSSCGKLVTLCRCKDNVLKK